MFSSICFACDESPPHVDSVPARAGDEPLAASPISRHASFGLPLMTAVTHAATVPSAVDRSAAELRAEGVASPRFVPPCFPASLAVEALAADLLSALEVAPCEHPVRTTTTTESAPPAIQRVFLFL
ncbi:hypothetical protein [Streptomyces sp. NPDC005423]|uniref:hypothetical protein n=1 Tax=Streptomyces sp. NPDC005423 TaxID=3155343 RepID=UPI0033A78B53